MLLAPCPPLITDKFRMGLQVSKLTRWTVSFRNELNSNQTYRNLNKARSKEANLCKCKKDLSETWTPGSKTSHGATSMLSPSVTTGAVLGVFHHSHMFTFLAND